MGHLSTYFDYSRHEKYYKPWNEQQNVVDSKRKYLAANESESDVDLKLARKKAKIITDTILVTDNYSQTKAEDIEAFCQTTEIELVAALTTFSALPIALAKAVTPLSKLTERFPGKADFFNSLIKKLDNYKNLNINLKAFKMPLSNFASIATTAMSFIGYFIGMNWIVTRQVEGTRRARFECLNNELSDVHNFAILTDNQENEINQILNKSKSQNNEEFIDKEVKDLYNDVTKRVDVAGSVKSAEPLIKGYDKHLKEKKKYYDNLAKNEANYSKTLTKEQIIEAEKTKQLYENIVKKVDNATHDTLERFEQLIYVGYGALFLGGFLESLLTGKTIDLANKILKINNPVAKKILSIGIPVVTCYILNKNLANFQNSAIKAVKYKKLKEFMDDKNNYSYFSQNKVNSVSDSKVIKQKSKRKNIFEVVSSVRQDIKEYNRFEKNDLQDLKAYLNAKSKIKLSDEQLKEAEFMKKNTFMVMNKTDDRAMKYLESIETISEIILQPLEMGATPIGMYLGKEKIMPMIAKMKNPGVNLDNIIKSGKYKNVAEVIGAVIAFIPSAILEIYLTHKHRNALRVANMQTVNEFKDYRQFADYNSDNKNNKHNTFVGSSILNKFNLLFNQRL